MVRLTRLNGSELWLNPLLIESVEATPDSVITLSNGHKYIVSEKPGVIEQLIADFYRGIGLVAADAGKGVSK
ncbi:flagellar FlbD family protein [Alicyclobacillus fastidiosus]|uniref:Flagellar FlbD family protein n=1 Tax=Alicyclobacillus fastidiosus TaxID=392011 RepID=A0ABY6ZNT9_9BACL|nr:flagellar FlbD family protein [Alicyclobacillus fastidiosus]WAH44648.1 flagellar FlbD family protein [Alicyclobacillus fastidiosus]GMA61559.1 flagellar protein FlbD [Alicyclobacillus fastidiosus]